MTHGKRLLWSVILEEDRFALTLLAVVSPADTVQHPLEKPLLAG